MHELQGHLALPLFFTQQHPAPQIPLLSASPPAIPRPALVGLCAAAQTLAVSSTGPASGAGGGAGGELDRMGALPAGPQSRRTWAPMSPYLGL